MPNQLRIPILVIGATLICLCTSVQTFSQDTVFGPKKYVRQSAKPEVVTDTFYITDIAQPFSLSVQNDGPVGGPSSAVITLNGVEILGPADFNNSINVLRKSVFLQQQNTISVELRSKPGTSVSVTIHAGHLAPTTTQFTVFTNPTDPLWLRQETPEGDVIDFFGDRDAEGLPTTLYGVNIMRANGDEITYYFDDQGRPILMGMPNGVTFSIEWQSDSFILLTAFSDYGNAQITVPIDLASQSLAPSILPEMRLASFSPISLKISYSSKTSVGPLVGRPQGIPANATSVKVTQCGVPTNHAFVRIPVAGRPGPPILAKPIGNGVYVAGLPIPPPNFARPLHQLCTAIQQRISEVCDKIMALRLGGVPTNMICNSVDQAAAADPRLALLGTACRIGFGLLSVVCSAAKPCARATGYLDRAISAPITFRPIATLYGITKCGDSVTAPPNGPFPTALPIDFPCSCQSGLGVRLFSTGRNIQIAVVPPEADFVDEIRLSSPVFRNIATNTYTGPPINISSYRVGVELIFSIFVRDTGMTFFTGPGSRNPDGLVHAKVDCLPNGRIKVSFEDVLGGGDNDFDDAVFEIISGNFEGPICR